MKKILQYLSEHPWLNAAMALAYYLAVVLPHEQVGLMTVPVREALGWDAYNLLLLGLSGAALLGYAFFWAKNWRKLKEGKNLLLLALLATIVFSAASFRWLIIVNIEAIHFVQYAVMAVLLFPLVRRFGEALFWATLLGTMDEAYQYFYLAPQRTDYFDFNDVILNLLGAAFGLLMVATLGKFSPSPPERPFYRSPVFWVVIGLTVFLTISFAGGWLHFYPEEGEEWPLWAIVRDPKLGFWKTVHPGVTYHVVKPLEGVVLVIGLLFFYGKTLGPERGGIKATPTI